MNKEINTIIANLEGCIGMFDYLLTPTESKLLVSYIEELQQENQKYKKIIDKVSSQIKLYGKYDGEKCTRCFSMMTADFNKLLDILKVGEINE